MRSVVSELTLVRPRSLAGALRSLRDDPALVPMAGCTDLYVALNAGKLEGRRFLDLWGLDALRGIRLERGLLRIGALATYTDLIHSRLVCRRIPMLVMAAKEVGGVQVQNRGTIGGNVANASPAGDTLPVLSAASATVILESAAGTRSVGFDDFYRGYRKTVRRPDEIVTAVEIPEIDGVQWFRKVGTRAAQAISKVVMAAVRAEIPRIAIGSVAPTVVRARGAETALANGGSIEDAVSALERDIAPIDDVRSTAAYRRRVAENLLRRFWLQTSLTRRSRVRGS
jgi:CO/xanthine dehydrogenase FAD-binding subunit